MERLSTISTLTFDQYIVLCTDIEFIESLSRSLLTTKSRVRSFLTSYVFKYFLSEVMFTDTRTPDIDIISKAETVITDPSIENITDYITSFTSWKEFDKPRTATPFINKYKILRNIREKGEFFYYKKELKLLVDMTFLQLITMINSIGGEDSLLRIDTDPEPPHDKVLEEEFNSSAKESFWSEFREELPKYDRVLTLLIDFAARYQLLIPNRIDLLEGLAEVLDLEFIQQQLESGVMSIESLVSYMNFIVTKTKEVDMPSEDEITDQWFIDLKGSIRAVSDPIYFLQSFFDYILNRLDTIRSRSIELTPTIKTMYEAKNDNSIAE